MSAGTRDDPSADPPSDAQFLDAFVAWADVVVSDAAPSEEGLVSGAAPWAMLSLLCVRN